MCVATQRADNQDNAAEGSQTLEGVPWFAPRRKGVCKFVWTKYMWRPFVNYMLFCQKCQLLKYMTVFEIYNIYK